MKETISCSNLLNNFQQQQRRRYDEELQQPKQVQQYCHDLNRRCCVVNISNPQPKSSCFGCLIHNRVFHFGLGCFLEHPWYGGMRKLLKLVFITFGITSSLQSTNIWFQESKKHGRCLDDSTRYYITFYNLHYHRNSKDGYLHARAPNVCWIHGCLVQVSQRETRRAHHSYYSTSMYKVSPIHQKELHWFHIRISALYL